MALGLARRLTKLERAVTERCRPGECRLPTIAMMVELPDALLVDEDTGAPANEPDWRCARCAPPGTGMSAIITVMSDRDGDAA